MTEVTAPAGRTLHRYGPGSLGHPLWLTFQWELEKLTAQFRTRLALVVALLGPALFAIGLKLATDVPADTLFGRWVGDSGYAVALVVLGFAGAWGFPLLMCLVAGDIFPRRTTTGRGRPS